MDKVYKVSKRIARMIEDNCERLDAGIHADQSMITAEQMKKLLELKLCAEAVTSLLCMAKEYQVQLAERTPHDEHLDSHPESPGRRM